MEHLDSEINSLLKSSMACNTWKTYNSAIESFNKFRQIYKLPDIWPVSVQNIVRYIAHLSHAKTSASTVATYISGLSHVHKLNGFDDPTKSFFVSKILEGFKRKNPGSKDLRMPVSSALLKQLINSLPHVCTSSYEASMFASAFSLAFFAMLRVGEFAADKKCDSGRHVVRLRDVIQKRTNLNEELHIKIRSSKTDQVSNSTTLVIYKQPDIAVCPVKLMNLYLNKRLSLSADICKTDDMQLYIHFDGTLLTRYQFSSVLQKCLQFGEVPGHFRPHSFRLGGATEAKRRGVDDDVIKQWGRWSSSAYLRYIRL